MISNEEIEALANLQKHQKATASASKQVLPVLDAFRIAHAYIYELYHEPGISITQRQSLALALDALNSYQGTMIHAITQAELNKI